MNHFQQAIHLPGMRGPRTIRFRRNSTDLTNPEVDPPVEIRSEFRDVISPTSQEIQVPSQVGTCSLDFRYRSCGSVVVRERLGRESF